MAKQAKIASDPDYVTSIILQKHIEMIRPRKIAVLILIERGWLRKYNRLKMPARFKLYHASQFLKSESLTFHGTPGSIGFNTTPILGEWLLMGMVEKIEVFVDCAVSRELVLSHKGKALLSQIAPEVMAASRGMARAIIWTAIKDRRRRRKFQIEIDAREKEFTKNPMPPANPKARIKAVKAGHGKRK